MWFKELTGFEEVSPDNVRHNLQIDGDAFISKVNSKRLTFGKLEIATLAQLRKKSPSNKDFEGKIQVSELIADVQDLHCQVENSGSLFQAASQFNLLEMVGPHISPEHGIDRYEYDYTQGPACAIACGAGTIYRNYFIPFSNRQLGQTESNQIDCLDLIGGELENDKFDLWEMKNGYVLTNLSGLLKINEKLLTLDEHDRESLKGKLKTGIQWGTEVTKSNTKHKVSQIYCSALPVAYNSIEPIYWEPFARLVLDATYESALFASLINFSENGSNLVYLTLVGGGAFGNEESWIIESLMKAIRKFKNVDLDVRVVSYGHSNASLQRAIHDFREKY